MKLFLGSVVLILLSFFINYSSERGSPPPNVVFIMADDHALEAISSYGSYLQEYARTPNIDRLADEGMRLTNVCCNNSICSPSRASILTGQYSHRNGVMGLNQGINEDSPWFSLEMQKSGYSTCVIGKWHLESWPRGFDEYWITKKQGAYFNPVFFRDPESEPENYQGYSADVYTDLAIDWLERQEGSEKPFALCLQFKGPHHPYDYPERYTRLLEDIDIPEPENMYEDLQKSSTLLKKDYWAQLNNRSSYFLRHINDSPPNAMGFHDPENDSSRVRAAYQHMMHKYIRCITANDHNVGRVLDYLDEKGLAENTIVIYTSDQGYWLGQHGFYDKRLILDESLKMPFLIRYPGHIDAGTVSEAIVNNVDFAPTFLELAGLKVHPDMQGESFINVLKGKPGAVHREASFYAYWATWPAHWGIRCRDYTYVEFPQTDSVEYYDLRTDPQQNVNQGQNPDYADRLERARKMMEEVMMEVEIETKMLPVFREPRADRNRKKAEPVRRDS